MFKFLHVNLSWCLEVECFSWSCVEEIRNFIEIILCCLRQVGAFGQKLPISKAARLEDGRAVFMAKGGSIYAEDDTANDLAAQNLKIEWPENAPSYEEFVVARAKAHPNWEKHKAKRKKKNKPPSYEEFCEVRLHQERTQAKYDLFKTYQSDVLGYARARMSNTEDPPSKEEMTILKNLLENSIVAIEN